MTSNQPLRVIGRYATVETDGTTSADDIGSLIEDLLLFDHVIVDSMDLVEIAALLRAFDHGAVVDLLKAGCISFTHDVLSFAVSDSNHLPPRPGGRLRPGAIAVGAVGVIEADRRRSISEAMARIAGDAHVAGKARIRLKSAIKGSLAPVPHDAYLNFLGTGATEDLASRPDVIANATRLALRRRTRADVPRHELKVRLEQVEPSVFLPESNLEALGIEAAVAHEVVRDGVLAVGARTKRIADMKFHDCRTGFQSDDLPLFEEKLDFVERSESPDPQRARFRRVIEVADLPSLGQAVRDRSLRLDRLLELRDSEPCRQFRRFLATADQASDQDIKNMAGSLRAKIGAFVARGPGKLLRFLVTNALGFVPGATQAPGLFTSAVDTFLLDRLLRSSGPATFLSASYPSLFERGRDRGAAGASRPNARPVH